MQIVFAIPFRARPPKDYAEVLRQQFAGCKIAISQPADSTEVRGADVIIFHMNFAGEEMKRTLHYANNIMRPLCEAAKTLGDVVVYLHDDIVAVPDQVATLEKILSRIPLMQFACPQPLMVPDLDGKPRVANRNSRFVVWKAERMMEWLAPFTIEDFTDYRSAMEVAMDRIVAAGIDPIDGWTWQMDMVVQLKQNA